MFAKTIIALAAFATTVSAITCPDHILEVVASFAFAYGPDVQRCYGAAGFTSPLLQGGAALSSEEMSQLCASAACYRAMRVFGDFTAMGCDFSGRDVTIATLAPRFVDDCTKLGFSPLYDDPKPACDVVQLLLATDGDDSTQCEKESGFSFATATDFPIGKKKRICRSAGCVAVVDALKRAGLPTCTTISNIDTLHDFVGSFDSDCDQLLQLEPHDT